MTHPIVRSMVLWVPDWPVRAAIRAWALAVDAPIALIEKGQVFACSAAARAEGVKRGLRLREAQSRSPGLVVKQYEQQLDYRAFETVVTAIEEIMSGVQLLRPGICAVRIRGPARYYGGEKPAALAMLGLVDSLGVPGSRVGVADGPFTAEQAARMTGRDARIRIVPEGGAAAFLGPLSANLLDAPQLVTLLRRLGVKTLADFAALPAADVLGRFGEGVAHLHALAGGLDSRPIVPRIPPDELDVAIDFEPPLDRVDQVTFGFRASADRFIEQLTAARLVCTALRVELATESGELSGRSWLHPRSFTAADVVDRVRWQLQGSGEVDTALNSGIVRVRVVPEAVDTIGNHEVGLFGAGPDERIHSGLSRVQGMLGHGGVLTAVIGGGRILGDRQVMVPWGDRALIPRLTKQPWPGQLPKPAPATVFPVPHPVHVIGANGESVGVDARGAVTVPPARFSPTGTGRELRQITAWAGPWPVDERWWSEDAKRAHRFQVVDAAGVGWLLVLEGADWSAEARYD